jgi:cleavage and polyadenylation specificity factor subunit 2
MFSFTLVTPAKDDYSCKAGLLTFDHDIKILTDPSWNGKNPDDILFIEQYLTEVLGILLSHSTPEFLSGYILLCLKFPNLMATIPVYSTLPVNQLGRISTVEYYRSHGYLGPLKSSILELDEIDEWFDKVNPLKYLQSISLFDNKLNITPYNAGHTLGGTFWLITKRINKVIYAPAWNHSRDSFLNSAGFLSATNGNPLSQLLRPTAIITSTDIGSTMPHKKRTEKFLSLVSGTLSNGGAVLLPTSLSGRFLELFHLIDEHLQGAPIPVYFLSYSGTKILSYASNLLDWMSPGLLKDWEEATSDGSLHKIPFEPSKVDLLGDPNELIQLSGPKIVFCSGSELTNGELSSEAFQYLCQDEKTTVLLTEKSHFGLDMNITSVLYQEWYNLVKQKNNGKVEDGIPVPLEKVISIDDWTREESLVGTELSDYQERVHSHRKQRLLAKVREKKNRNLLDSDTIDAEDSSDEEDENFSDEEDTSQKADLPTANGEIASNQSGNVTQELVAHEAFITDYIKQTLDENKPLDLKLTHKLKPRQAMFPYVVTVHKQKFDDYGEVIDIKQFQKSEDNTNTQIIMEGKKKFEQREKKKGGKNSKNGAQSKLTPQEQLNNQLLEKYLDSLYKPKKRVSLNASGSSFNTSSQLRVRCGLSFVDLSGLVDIRSLNVIVSALKPYNLILLPDFTTNPQFPEELNGMKTVEAMFSRQQDEQKSEETKKNLYTTNRYLSLSTIRNGSGIVTSYGAANKMNVLPVTIDEPINIGGDNESGGVGLSNFEVKLDDSIVEGLNWQKIDGSYRVAQVYGELEIQNPKLNETPNKKRELSDYINSQTLFTLKKIKREDFIAHSSTKPKNVLDTSTNIAKLAIGNIRLPELKKKLMSKDLQAEFKSEGTLVVNDTIAVRKVAYSNVEGDDTGDIIIDGAMGPLYYEVKECIREMLAYV